MKLTILSPLMLLSALLLVVQCSSKKERQLMESNNYIIVGEGGGFTGAYIQYKIEGNGIIYQYDFMQEAYIRKGRLKDNELSPLFAKIEELDLGDIELSSPGNMSQYIEITYKDIKEHRLIWAMQSKAVNPEIQAFFDSCYSLCKQTSE